MIDRQTGIVSYLGSWQRYTIRERRKKRERKQNLASNMMQRVAVKKFDRTETWSVISVGIQTQVFDGSKGAMETCLRIPNLRLQSESSPFINNLISFPSFSQDYEIPVIPVSF